MANWDDLRIAPGARSTGANAAALANVNGSGIYAWRFTNNKELFFDAQLPHAYQIGGPLKPHVHWMPDASETYTGTWTLEYLWCNPAQVAPISNKIALTGAISGGKTAWVPQITAIDSAAMNQAFGLSALFLCRLALTLSAGSNIFLLGFDFHYEQDALGSASEFAK